MKLKFVLVPLAVLGLAVGSYADDSENGISKFIDKLFSTTKINGISDKRESKLSWVNPSRKTCISYGGKIRDGECSIKWVQVKDICSASSARLPTIYEFRKVIVDCGGVVNDYDNSFYQSCYKQKGFTSNGYWSSTTDVSDTSDAWFVLFSNGSDYWYNKTNELRVRCVRIEQK